MSKRVDNIMVQLIDYTDEIMQDLAFSIHGQLVDKPPKGTPIDTGYASSKWWFAVSSLPGIDGGAENTQVVASYTLNDGPIFIYNDTPYISRLNAGWSKQSPAFFVEDAADENVLKIQQKYEARIYVA